jgi:hypothetical protein
VVSLVAVVAGAASAVTTVAASPVAGAEEEAEPRISQVNL